MNKRKKTPVENRTNAMSQSFTKTQVCAPMMLRRSDNSFHLWPIVFRSERAAKDALRAMLKALRVEGQATTEV
eukprot:2082842-Amphidinium_carterae.1